MNRLYTITGILATAFALSAVATQSAFAAGAIAPDGSNWGSATSDFAPLGEHASSFGGTGFDPDQGREGLGNLAQLLGSWCAVLGFIGFPCT